MIFTRRYFVRTIALVAFASVSMQLCMAHEFRRARTFEDAFKASCRVSVANARGTGTFIGYDAENDRCIVLTNYHVVTSNNTASLDFWTNGVRETVSARVFARFYDARKPYDFALLAVNPSELKRVNPPFVALGGKGAVPDANSYIMSAGCPKGRFVQAWKGKVLGYYSGTTVEFQPAPVPGQSGSGVLSEVDGELWLTAVLTWLIGQEGADESKGGAIPIANLYDALRGGTSRTSETKDDFSPIPPNAVECADVIAEPYVEVFTQDNCPPCERAAADVAALRTHGTKVEVFNISTSDGRKHSEGKDVRSTPLFIVFDWSGKEFQRYVSYGHTESILHDVELLKQKHEDTESPAVDSLSVPESDVPTVLASDFRNRAPVYEYENELGEITEQSDVNFFDDSDACWRTRRNGGEAPKDDAKPEPPVIVQPPAIDEDKLGDRLFNRLGRGLQNGLSDKLSGQLDGAIEYAEKRLEDKANSMATNCLQKLEQYWNSIKWKLFCAYIAVLVFSLICAEAIKDGLCSIYKSVFREQATRVNDSENEESGESSPKQDARETDVQKSATRRKANGRASSK